MLDKRILKILPQEYNYKKTVWYNKLASDITDNKRRQLLVAYFSTLLFPAVFLVIDLLSGENRYIINYTIPVLILGTIFFYILYIRASGKIITLTIIIAFAGFFTAAYLPQGRQVSVFIMIAFTPFVFNLTGLVRGIIWTLFFFGTIALSMTLSSLSIIPESNLIFADYHLLMISLSIVIVFVLIYSGHLQYEKHLQNLFTILIFDSATGLPNKDTMITSFPQHKGFIIAIVRIQNFSTLSSLFGYEIAEKILLFVAKTLNEIAQRDGFSCFKLLGHEFGILINEDSSMLTRKNVDDLLNVLWFELQSIKLIERDQEFCPPYRIGAARIQAEDTADALSRADIALNMADKLLHNIYIYNELFDDRIHV